MSASPTLRDRVHRLLDREKWSARWRRGDAMFGRPEWFVPKTCGWGLTPVTWQGWVYTAVWSGVLIGPFLALLVNRGAIQATVWLAASGGLLVWDVWRILRAKRQAATAADVLYIGDEGERAATRSFDLQVRR